MWLQFFKCIWMVSTIEDILLRQEGKTDLQSIWIFNCRTLCQIFHKLENHLDTCNNKLFHLFTKFKTVLTVIHAFLSYKVMLAKNIHVHLSHSTSKACSPFETQCSCITSKTDLVLVKVRFRFQLQNYKNTNIGDTF